MLSWREEKEEERKKRGRKKQIYSNEFLFIQLTFPLVLIRINKSHIKMNKDQMRCSLIEISVHIYLPTHEGRVIHQVDF